MSEVNKNANPNTLWEIIKGSNRNESIKYASYKKKEQNKKEIQLIKEINTLKSKITSNNDHENELKRLKEEKKSRTTRFIRTRIVFLQKNRCLPPFCCRKYQNVPK